MGAIGEKMVDSALGYISPTLTVFGSMVRLTASGAGASCENGTSGSSGNCKAGTAVDPLKRP